MSATKIFELFSGLLGITTTLGGERVPERPANFARASSFPAIQRNGAPMPLVSDSVRGLASALIVTALIVLALVHGKAVLVPFALATILAFVLAPIVRWLTALRMSRGLASSLVVLSTVILVGAMSVVFSHQILSLTASLPSYQQNILEKVRSVTRKGGSSDVIRRASEAIDGLERDLSKEVSDSTKPSGTTPGAAPSAPIIVEQKVASPTPATTYFAAVLNPIAAVGLTLLFTVFLLAQYQDLRDRVVRVAGTENMSVTVAALNDAGTRLSQMFMMLATLNGGFGLITGIALWLIGVPNAILWGVAAGVLRFVPFIGAFLGAIPPLALAAAVDPGWTMVLATLAFFVVVEPIFGHVLEPLVVGKRAGLSPFAFILSASFWTLVWGPIGLLLAAPVTMAIAVLSQYLPRFEFMSVLLGDAAALGEDEEFYHRLLSSDVTAAFAQIEDDEDNRTINATSDSIVLPALRLAARDIRMERLDDQQIGDLNATIVDVASFIRQDRVDAPKKAGDRPDAKPSVVFIPARGSIDGATAQYLAAIIDHQISADLVCVSQSSGFTAVSAARALIGTRDPAQVVIVSASSRDEAVIRHIETRCRREFADAEIIVFGPRPDDQFDLGRRSPPTGATSSSAARFSKVDDLVFRLERQSLAQSADADDNPEPGAHSDAGTTGPAVAAVTNGAQRRGEAA